jgi:hypothetical protein
LGEFDWTVFIALVALLLSLYNTRKGQKLAQKQEALADVKSTLHKLQLQLEKVRILEMHKADFGARFIKEGKSRKLVITNKGKAEARNVEVIFVEGPYFVLNNEIESKFPMTSMDSMSSVRLIASAALGIREVKERFIVEWTDDTGFQRKEFDIPAY